jgi:hypothetical protein
MSEGFEYDLETVRARVEALRTPSAAPADFGESRTRHGVEFRLWLAVLAEDLTHLPPALDAIGEADTTALRELPSPESRPESDLPEDGPAGRIGADLARLEALATALADLAGPLEHEAAVATLTDYATAVRAAATGMRCALAGLHAATDESTADADAQVTAALAPLRALAHARPFSSHRQLLALGRQVTVVAGSADHLTVTVADGVDGPTIYDLDFDAASGVASGAAPTRADGLNIEGVPAGTNGKCVFEHNGVTITVERGLFDASTATLVIDDGVNEPSTHTMEVPPAPPVVVPVQADSSDEKAAASTVASTGIGWSVHGDLFDTRDPVHSVHGVLALDD